MRNRTKFLVAINLLIAVNFAVGMIAKRYAKASEWKNALGLEEQYPFKQSETECRENSELAQLQLRCMQGKGWMYVSQEEQANDNAHFYTCLTRRKEIDAKPVAFSNDEPWRLRFHLQLPLSYYGDDLIRWWLYAWRDSKAIFFGNNGHGVMEMEKGRDKGLKLEIALSDEDSISTRTFMECQPDTSRTDDVAPLELYEKSFTKNSPVAPPAMEENKQFRVGQ